MVVVGRTESVMADGEGCNCFMRAVRAWCAFIPRLKKSNVDYFRQLHVTTIICTCGEKYPVTRGGSGQVYTIP